MANAISYPQAAPKKGDFLLGTSVPTADEDDKNPVTRNFDISAVNALANAVSVGYTSYSARWSQVGTAAPANGDLRNTTGLTFTWTRFGAGIYRITSSGAIDSNKLYTIVTSSNKTVTSPASTGAPIVAVTAIDSSNNYIELRQVDSADKSLVDNVELGYIEIRIYV